MTFASPQALLLLVPIALLLWRFGLPSNVSAWMRGAALLLLTVALAQPLVRIGGGGRDLVVVVDRSRSMPSGSDQRALEMLRLLDTKRGADDRVGVVSFGRQARIERLPSPDPFGGFQREVSGDGSDLAGALDAAGDLLSPGREGRVLLVSDGLSTSGDARAAARRLAERGIPVDFRHLARTGDGADAAVASLDVPSRVSEGEPFQFSATVTSTSAREVGWTLRRGSVLLARGRSTLQPGANRLTFRDRLERPGLADYTLELDSSDAVPENDRARAVTRVAGSQRVLVVRSDGAQSGLVRALSSSDLQVEVTSAPPRTLEALEGVGVVVLENVPASALGEQGLQVLARFVRDMGGGLLMTGGRRSFGEGGYHRSALDELLPVSMELRDEQRKASLALGIAMDRSGSMSVTTSDGRPKMQLAAEGAVAALQLLMKGDEAAVWVVDTRVHTIFPLTPVEHGLSLDLVASVRSEGGGIYVGEALRAAADELERSKKATRHLILFSDASDSEEPADYRDTLDRMRRNRITVSVIGLGSATDPDAPLLEEIAQRGGGRVYFAQSAQELPRLFSEETIVLARAAFVDEPVPTAQAPDLALLGAGAVTSTPRLGGYNLTWVRPRASVALRTQDENEAPIVAFWPVGLGQTAVFAAEADGEFSGELRTWDGYRGLFTRLVRRLMPSSRADGVLTKTRRDGHELVVTVETDEPVSSASASLVAGDGSLDTTSRALRWEDAHRLTARFPLEQSGSFFPVIQLDGRTLRAAPATLPYAPEFEPRDPADGRRLLEDVARLSGGAERLSLESVFTAPGSAPARRSLSPWLVAAALLLALAEVATRRLGWHPSWPALPALPRRRASSAPARTAAPSAPTPAVAAEPDSSPPPSDDVRSALEQARERARRRIDR